jgi:hypothetical protein
MSLYLKLWLGVGFVVWLAELAGMAEAVKEVEDRWGRVVIGALLTVLCVIFWPWVMHRWIRRDLDAVGLGATWKKSGVGLPGMGHNHDDR